MLILICSKACREDVIDTQLYAIPHLALFANYQWTITLLVFENFVSIFVYVYVNSDNKIFCPYDMFTYSVDTNIFLTFCVFQMLKHNCIFNFVIKQYSSVTCVSHNLPFIPPTDKLNFIPLFVFEKQKKFVFILFFFRNPFLYCLYTIWDLFEKNVMNKNRIFFKNKKGDKVQCPLLHYCVGQSHVYTGAVFSMLLRVQPRASLPPFWSKNPAKVLDYAPPLVLTK